jgi:hypothetical protein
MPPTKMPRAVYLLASFANLLTKTLGIITNCTENSFRIPSWTVDNLQYDKVGGTGSFRLANRVNEYSADITCAADGSCVPDSAEGNVDVSAAFDGGSLEVTVNQTWICDDKTWNNAPVRY